MNDHKPDRISWQASFVLDIVRLVASFIVFFHHAYSMWYHNVLSEKMVHMAHFSVVVFFVLSGFLIAYTTSGNNRGAFQYAQARLSRLYSILLPAILVSGICQLIIFFADPALYGQYSRPPVLLRYFLSTFFLNEIWFFSAAPAINSPLWSMGYEFWYYLIFGLWFYLKKSWKSFFILLFAIVLAGPSILAMMPIWLMGCMAYRISLRRISNSVVWLIFFFGLAISFIVLDYMNPLPFQLGIPPLHYANEFIKDGITGFFVAASVFAIARLRNSRPIPRVITTFRKIADLTFPLYLLHFPLLILWRSFVPLRSGDILQ
ncbi:MAG: acyltransferase, partial [Chitinophagaceae bacterium]